MDSWIADVMSDPEHDGPLAALVLLHVRDGKDTSLDQIRFTGAKQWKASELALRFRSRAEAYAQDIPGSQTFNLLAFYKTGQGDDASTASEPEGRFPFVIMGEATANNSLGTEAPDNKGQVQQGMRHLEVMFTENLRMGRALREHYETSMQLLSEQNRTLNQEVIGVTKMLREMYLQSRGEEHRMHLEEQKMDQTAKLLEGLVKFAPALVNTLTGKEVFPQPTADTALVEALIQSATPELVQALSSTLPPQTMGLLASRLEKGLEARIQAEQSAGNVLRHKLTGEADVAGELTK